MTVTTSGSGSAGEPVDEQLPRFGVETVLDRGDSRRRFDIVVLGDGYRADELVAFAGHVRELARTLVRTAPFDLLAGLVNVHRIDVVSPESGARDPVDCADGTTGSGADPRTFLGATFGSHGRRRLLTVDTGLALRVAYAHVDAPDLVVVIVNSPRYGGSGGDIACLSTHPRATEIGLHEIGHTAFDLRDAYPCGATHAPQCRMRRLGQPFCAPCQQQIRRRLLASAAPYPASTAVVTRV